jgi:hypothetical protein
MTDDNGNGRVTLGILGAKMDQVLAELRDIKDCQQIDHDRVGKLESQVTVNRRDIDTLDGEIDKVDASRKWEGRIEALVLAAAALGSWFRP